jgi:IrrE N-terminal-like domain
VTKLVLDRMALDDVGYNPQRLAEAIHAQLGQREGPIPVHDIALALDIEDIRIEPLNNLEAALVTTPERSYGQILLNRQSGPERRRFSAGHELLHFLNPLHVPTAEGGFRCTRADMRASGKDLDRHLRQEAEANAFAVELLTPRPRMRSYLRGNADLRKVLAVADDFDISREAAARRFVNLHSDNLAAVFCKDRKFLYADRPDAFPGLCLSRGQAVSLSGGEQGDLSDFDDADPRDWLFTANRGSELLMQTLWQGGGYSITLLHAIEPDEADDPGIDDTYERFTGGRAR